MISLFHSPALNRNRGIFAFFGLLAILLFVFTPIAAKAKIMIMTNSTSMSTSIAQSFYKVSLIFLLHANIVEV